MELLGHTFDIIGKIMVSYTAISVHYRFWKEHKIDEVVFKHMHRERVVGLMGILFMIVGYLLEVPYKI